MKLHNDPAAGMPMLDEQTADEIMARVFSSCNLAPNTIPLSTLASYAEYRRERYSLQKGIVIFMLAVFLLLPLFFLSPRYTLEEVGKSSMGLPTYELTVTNLLPVRMVSAKLNGTPLAVYESGVGVYTVEPNANGRLDLTVTLTNRQYETLSLDISGIDISAPTLLRSEMVEGRLRIYLSDGDGVGIDYANIRCISSSDGSELTPTAFNEAEGYVELEFSGNMNIFVPDLNRNTLQLVLSLG